MFYRDDKGCLARFKGADGQPLVLAVYSSIGSGSGVACEGAAGSQFLVRTTATAGNAKGQFDVHDIRLRRTGDHLVNDVDVPGTIVDDGSAHSPLLRYTSITNCNLANPGD